MSQADSGNTTPMSRGSASAGASSSKVTAFPRRPTVQLAHSLLIGALAGNRPHTIHVSGADRADVEERSHHLSAILNAVSTYVRLIVEDTAANLSCTTINRDYLAGCLSDATAEVVGMVARAAHGIDETVEA